MLGTGWVCIWDAGGNDTISNAGSDIACRIDLREAELTGAHAGGYISWADGIMGGFTIAANAAVENATGGGGADILIGNALNNVLDGGAGPDTLRGGAGDDSYWVDEPLDRVVELADEGLDTVYASVSVALGAHVENLTLTGSSNAGGDGNTQGNLMQGNGGANLLRGRAGDDTLQGGGGNDRLEGGDGNDDLQGGTGRDTLSGAEGSDSLQGGGDNDSLLGGAGRDTLLGDDGADTLDGGTSGDVLDGGVGADLMRGGDGDDSYWVDDVLDTIEEGFGRGSDTVHTTVSYTLPLWVDDLVMEGADALTATGSARANVIWGNAAANILRGDADNDTLYGGGGKDTLNGGSSNDYLDGGSGVDLMRGSQGDDMYVVDEARDRVEELADQGWDVVFAFLDWTLGDHVEELSLEGTGGWSGTGNALDNRLWGNDGANHLSGLDGADSLFGEAGDDVLDGGTGADALTGGSGDDSYWVDDALDRTIERAGGGLDTVHASRDWTLAANLDQLVLEGAADLRGTGNSLSNLLQGNAGANVLRGMDGDDTLVGGAGADRLAGGAGADHFVFTAVSDSPAGKPTRDSVADFDAAAGDRIDLHAIDADTGAAGKQSFQYIGGAAFTGSAGQLRMAGEVLSGDVDGDARPDLQIRLVGFTGALDPSALLL